MKSPLSNDVKNQSSRNLKLGSNFILTLALALLIAMTFSHLAVANILSAKRAPNEDYKNIIQKHLRSLTTTSGSAYSNRTQIQNLDLAQIPELTDFKQVEQVFNYVRDIRFLRDSTNPKSPRRLTWLYPDDGCYARATMVNHLIETDKVATVLPYKVFIFGNLNVSTDNSPDGAVSWWYHVVPIVRVGQTAYVIDPAIDPTQPLALNAWVNKMTESEDSVELSVCDSKAHGPYSYCQGDDDQFKSAEDEIEFGFLSYERRRLEDLGRNADQELGDNPPWYKH